MSFIHKDFLLQNQSAKVLYHDYAKDLPIIDYHCHLEPKEIAENKTFENLTDIWLSGDHYKWRAMRYLGIEEELITGNASDYEKFKAWAKAMPYLIGNPLYHWTHLELKRYFDIDLILNEDTCEEIWNQCNTLLKDESFSAKSIIERSNVEMIGTTDDPLDSLHFHKLIKEDLSISTNVLPSFRPDSLLTITSPGFKQYVEKIGGVTNKDINNLCEFEEAIEERIHYFDQAGCKISDHAFENIPFASCTYQEAEVIFHKGLNGQQISEEEEEKYKSYLLLFMGKQYASLGWAMQLHIGSVRSNNKRMLDQLGPNTGFDSINDFNLAKPLNAFLNELEKKNQLPKTIIYSLNPTHNYIVASAAGNFQAEGLKGKVQIGSGWWFNDQKDGMITQMKDLANTGVLSTFIGMLTDSRSFLSYTRHEYFRRILCNLIGTWIENGEVPRDYKMIGQIIQDISYYNAKNYFEFRPQLVETN